MDTFKSFVPQIYEVNDDGFLRIALAVFRYQAENNLLYKRFLSELRVVPENIDRLEDIPFLPIAFFKTHDIKSGIWEAETTYRSSGTTGMTQSRHLVFSEDEYLINSRKCFEHFFGPLKSYHFLALLPSYLEREGSSLISMIRYFIDESGSAQSGFFLRDHERLRQQLDELKNDRRRVVLWGVSFALLDLLEEGAIDLSGCLVFETGGMKGRRREITRQELHETLKAGFNVPQIYSEYGMTELFSQAYSIGGMTFKCPPQMKVIGRDPSDPMMRGLVDETAALNVIDLSNWRTISFIETEDLGRVYVDGSFEVQGRMDNSEIRGCNLLI